MSDEITKPIESAVGTEPTGEVLPESTVEQAAIEPILVTSPSPIELTQTPDITNQTPEIKAVESVFSPPAKGEAEGVSESTPEVTSILTPNTNNQIPEIKVVEPTPEVASVPVADVGIGAEPTGEVQRPYSLDPKLNKMIEGFVRGMNRSKENLILAQKAVKDKMMKKVYKIMDLFKNKKSIKNDDVEKFIHTSDKTATKYLNILTKEGKVKREGNPHNPHYTKVE